MSRPNILFIVADDLGYADLGCYGGRAADFGAVSPVLDRLAASGLRLTQGYANSPVCSPTRFALATARYQYRLRGAAEEPINSKTRGTPLGEKLGLPPDMPTVASMLRDAGYRTALIGKWHLGYPPHFGPRMSGYEEFYGFHAGGADYFAHCDPRGRPDFWINEEPHEEEGYLTDLLSRRAVDFVERQTADKPFYLSLHYSAPHWPWLTRDDLEESRRIGGFGKHTDGGTIETYQRMIHHMDEGIGWVLDALEKKGMAENTLIVFTSDNGGERFSNNWPFIGQKMDLLEGGIRVPLVARWPERMPAGAVSDTPNLTMDWSATFLAAAGVDGHADYPLDGVSLLPLMEDGTWNPERDLCWRMKHRAQRALVRGDWKYLQIEGVEYLFNVAQDPRERANLRDREPQRLAELRQAWQQWDASLPPIPEEAKVSLVFSRQDLPSATF